MRRGQEGAGGRLDIGWINLGEQVDLGINLTGLDFIRTEHHSTFDGVQGYSLRQGQ